LLHGRTSPKKPICPEKRGIGAFNEEKLSIIAKQFGLVSPLR
jgi:hypothetical protein